MGKRVAGAVALAVGIGIAVSSPSSAATQDPLHLDACVGLNPGGAPCQVDMGLVQLLGAGLAAVCAGQHGTDLHLVPDPALDVPGLGSVPVGAAVSICQPALVRLGSDSDTD